jgi:hypothetical protein
MAATYSDVYDNGGDVSPWSSMISQAIALGGSAVGQALNNSANRTAVVTPAAQTPTDTPAPAASGGWGKWALIGGGVLALGVVAWLFLRK